MKVDDFPICMYDFNTLYKKAYEESGISDTPYAKPVVDIRAMLSVSEGDLFDLEALALPGYMIYHQEWKPTPNNTWVEISHMVVPTEIDGL